MRRIARVVALAALLLVQSGAVDSAYSAPARTPNYPGVDVSNGCYMYTDGKIFCNDGGYALSNIVPQYANEKIQIVLIMEVVGALQVCVAGSCANVSGSTTITFPEFGETPYGAPDLLQVTCISGPVRWYIQEINLIPISAPATDTPTATVNPSSTATNTVVPGSTDTPIPTSTPRGSVATLTPSITRTPAPSPTPNPYLNCGDVTFPLLNCTFVGGARFSPAPTSWVYGAPGGSAGAPGCDPAGTDGFSNPHLLMDASGGTICRQAVVSGSTGNLFVQYQANLSTQVGPYNLCVPGSCVAVSTGSCDVGTSNYCIANLGSVVASTSYDFDLGATANTSNGQLEILLTKAWVGSSSNTPTPGPTSTPSGPTATATDTPYPIPGASLTPYPSPTNCPGGCAVGDSTEIPAAIDTVVGIDTSPLTPLELLSVGRTSCQSFGAIPLVEPHLYGTPIYGSSQPISITWTVPATGTQFQPCADPNFSSAWWDTMWNLSILVAIVCWIGWLIHWVRGLFS